MRTYFLLILWTVTFWITPSFADEWFEKQTTLTQAHKKLLDNDLSGSFLAMVQVWQTETAPYMKEHLNQLLIKSLDKDCGKSLYSEKFAPWLKMITIQNQSIQSPGRSTERVIVEAVSREAIKDIELNRWPTPKLSSDSEFKLVEEGQKRDDSAYQKRYTLSQKLDSGLYQLKVTLVKGDAWNSWVIISNSPPKQIVRWESKDRWVVDKRELLNSYCPLPVLGIAIYDYIDDKYSKVWHQDYEADYPSIIPIKQLTPNRYVLAVSMTHRRWQGRIAVEDQQVISKTYDISEE